MVALLTADAYLDAFRRDGQALADAAERAGLSTEVPNCPDWRVADLLWHTGEIHSFWRTIVERRAADPDEVPSDLERPPDSELVAWYRDGVERTHAVLAATDPSTAVWTWAPQQKNAGFVQRRMAQETAVHRSDAEAAAGTDHVIEPALAVDGIDEFLRFYAIWVKDNAELLAGTVHIHCTDVGGEWLVADDGAGGLAVREEHAKGDVAVRARASDLLLLLWRRRVPADLEVFGDGPTLERLLARTNLD